MATTATPAAIDLVQVAEVLEVALSILQRHHDDDLAEKTLVMQKYFEMSKTHPERDYRKVLGKALADLTDVVQLHLNAELEAVATLLGKY